ncbi:Cytochrome P450-like protein [Hibiscus syriacus]|uniref:Cytochrome P450-like protein n=1 Tax=Hibiscus syriacus TaxID=106335 RepID=A0A6A2ZGX6_HIBSY|nr:Cytochrome P450-like protein [Hibiscus syriacus]
MLLVAAAYMLGVSHANKDWGSPKSNYTSWGWRWNSTNQHPLNETQGPQKIIVGGPQNWHFGFNYSHWAFQNAPFYFNDTLGHVQVRSTGQQHVPSHSVYLFPDRWSYLNCNLKRGKMIANATQGGGDGFEFVLHKWSPFYFACGEHNGIHCKAGGMKFMVVPLFRWLY